MQPQTLLLVYNADNGLFNALSDWAHKLFSPETYECSLCRYTYGLTGMRRQWKEFLESLGCPAVFLYRTQFRERYPHLDLRFPAILVETEPPPRVLLSAQEITAAGSLETLIELTRQRFRESET